MSHGATSSQQQAIESRGNVIVVAGAGTGKTSTLVQRCIRLLEEGGSIENLLMVTFTEAAALEMRGRIREALQRRLADLQGGSAAFVRHFEKQVALLDSALISTLHSFCMQLVREHFYELGIDPDVSVLDEQQTQPVIQQLFDRMFESHYAGSTDRDQAVQRLVRVQGRGSDEAIRAMVLRVHRYSQSLAMPEAWMERQRAMFNEATPECWREWMRRELPAWRDSWISALAQFTQVPAVAIAFEALRSVSDFGNLTDAAGALRTIRDADNEDSNWPRGSKTKVREPLRDFFNEAGFLASIAPSGGVDPLAEDWNLMRGEMLTLLDLAEEFTAGFSRIKREMGGVDFADLEQFALRVLRHPDGTPAAAALRWRQLLEHVFVDEYQDINAAQDAILAAVSREGDNANRFLVGDVKQSIYRFRLADPTIFRAYERRWSDGTSGRRIPLTDNFRSRQGILEFVNTFFGAVMRDSAGGVDYEPLQFGSPEARGALAFEPGDPRVELHLVSRSGSDNGSNGATADAPEVADLLATEREARLVAARLAELKHAGHEIWDKDEKRLRPVTWGDMAVLLRSPANRVEAFAKEFARFGIPLEAARAGFFESPEVSDLVCLLKVLDNPLQDVPLLAVLHSPLAGMTSAELAEVRASEPPGARVRSFHQAARRFWTEHKRAGAESNGRAQSAWMKLDLFYKQFGRWRELLRHTSVSQCLETALAETHYEMLLRARPRGDQQLANVRRLLELARDYDPYQRQGLFRFLKFIRSQEEAAADFEPPAASRDAVQLVSIHRSKGLEFPVVALAGLGGRFNQRDSHQSILLDEEFGLSARITPPDHDLSYPSFPYWLAQRRQRRELLGEELRLLYVAMTRARDTLLLFGTSSRKDEAAWESGEPGALSDDEILSAGHSLHWLRLWLPKVTRDGDWVSESEGKSTLLRWKIYTESAPELARSQDSAPSLPGCAPAELTSQELAALKERIDWRYPWLRATRLPAKTSVTELRRSQEREEESVPAPFIRPGTFTAPRRSSQRLTAAEIGTAHHLFLQRFSFRCAASQAALRAEAERLQESGWLTAEQASALDLAGLAAFWNSAFGSEILRFAEQVKRELPFTIGLRGSDLEKLNLGSTEGMAPDEIVVVQGVVDLALILPDQIRIVDFKTDAIRELELKEKVQAYGAQLRLYSTALARIYKRPVTRCALYFIALKQLVEIDGGVTDGTQARPGSVASK